jgi:hypothetical protein
MSRWRPSPLAHLTLGAALCATGCSRPAQSDAAGSTPATPAPSPAAPAASLPAPAAFGAEPLEAHPPRPPRPPPAGASATALRSDYRPRLTTLSISAHLGAATLRKRGSSWVTAGDNGCTVPARRIDQALDNLAQLKAEKTEEQPADGSAFELQLVALMGEEMALHLEIANRDNTADLVQLLDGSRVKLRGLNRNLWSPRPADWCKETDIQ